LLHLLREVQALEGEVHVAVGERGAEATKKTFCFAMKEVSASVR
jgi:hypothetical protein